MSSVAEGDCRTPEKPKLPSEVWVLVTANGWFAARPSGTEDVYKIYAESFLGAEHLAQVQQAARELVNTVIS